MSPLRCDVAALPQATKDDMLRIAVWETIFGAADEERNIAMIAGLQDGGAVWTGTRES